MKNEIPTVDYCNLSLNKNNNFLVESLSTYLDRNKDLVFPHRHNFYQVAVFISGEGTHSIDFEKFTIVPYQMYVMSPGQIHTWDFETEMFGYIVNFDADFFDTFLIRSDYLSQFGFFSDLHLSVFQIKKNLRSVAVDLLEKIMNNSSDSDYAKISLLYFFSIINKSMNLDLQTTNNQYTLLKNFKALIEQNYKNYKLPKQYAEQLYITANHLNAVSKEFLGISAGELIRNRILLEAKRMLVNQHYSISEIAYELNFNDNSYFSKFFKKLSGKSPDEFRRQYSK